MMDNAHLITVNLPLAEYERLKEVEAKSLARVAELERYRDDTVKVVGAMTDKLRDTESRSSVPVVTLHTTKEVRERVLDSHARYHSVGLVVGVVPKEEVDRYRDICFEFAAVLAADCNTLENALEKLSGSVLQQPRETSKA